MQTKPNPFEKYKHFKGKLYQVITLAKDSETGEEQVVYQGLYSPFEIYVRPVKMFLEELDTLKYPQATQKYRFELVGDICDGKTVPKENITKETKIKTQETKVEAQEAKVEAKVEAQETKIDTQEAKMETQESWDEEIDPLLMEFLDSDTYEQKINILVSLHHRITADMINVMAVALDIEVSEGNLEERYQSVKKCLHTFSKYECNRIR